jgi:DNA modification methylase
MTEDSLFDPDFDMPQKSSGPVTCLGLNFENDESRRAHYTEELRKKLQEPEFRKIEGFPIGSDEDILNLSDPPYYTACPNPWIADFIAEWESQKPEKPEGYHRKPFATDVKEGKNDPIYNAHSYHTKVPHKAIMRYILHYTDPGDIVFDGFCGTGMTGVAAQMCGDRDVVMSLGYQVKPDGTILQEEVGEDGRKSWGSFSKLGVRRAILNDLSTAATYISYNYNNPVDPDLFRIETNKIFKDVEKKYGWMYETKHRDGRKGKINYVVWSDVFRCPECSNEIVFWEVAVDRKNGKVRDEFPCLKCNALLTKRNVERAWETKFDPGTKKSVRQVKQAPVLINYSVGTARFEKILDKDDFRNIEKGNSTNICEWYPVEELPKGDKTGEPIRIGITHSHHFYSASSLAWLSAFREKCQRIDHHYLVPFSMINTISKLYRYNVKKPNYKGQGGGILTGTLYIPSLIRGLSASSSYKRGQSRLGRIFEANSHFKKDFVLSTGSSSSFSASDDCFDYVFIDPPFGSNLNYSELSFLWESWLGVKTSVGPEAIENKSQGKGGAEYRDIMTRCFSETYRILKPGRWMTVEFSNTKASVWNSIQTALTEAGFVVANVSSLDKKQGSFNAVTNTTSVKQDLVISAYKPNGGFEERFQKEAQTEEGVWDFVRSHLKYLPVTKKQGALLQFIPERDPRILFDQMVAFYVRKGFMVPISSQEFQIGLAQHFSERDGMFFLPDQAMAYDRKKLISGEVGQMSLFVSDEASAIQWLRQLIREKPQRFADINPQFMRQLGGWSKNEAQLDLRELLNQNFLCYDGKGPVPEQIHAYLSKNWKELRNLPKDDPALATKARDRWYVPDPKKQGDLEKLREKALLREFEEIRQRKKKFSARERFRNEAVRVGFKKAWQEKDYATIRNVAEKIPNKILEEDPKLLMWYDQAVTRRGGE